jgi:UDP-glucuronate 4-epimerase
VKQVVLVTGAAGFIGSHLAERLLDLGNRVIGLDNFDDFYSPATKWHNIQTLRERDSFELQQGDIRDTALLVDIFSRNKVDVVVHLAARAGVRPSLEQPHLYQEVNVGGTVSLLEASRTYGVKLFILASSSSVYGLNSQPPFSEETRVDYPISPYAASKAAAELFCRTYNHLYNLPVVALRLFTVYGPRQRPEMAIHRFTKMIEEGQEVTLFGNDTTSRDFTYIDDVIAGFEAALALPEKGFNIFNLGAGKSVDLRYLIGLIEEGLGKKARIKELGPQPGDVPMTLACISKARTILGYQPKVDIAEGIPRFVRWYLENKEIT